jgi:hypothetical protein
MVKQTHQQNQENSSRNTLIVMAIGALLVAGLVGWALTRTVEAPVTTPVASTEQFPTTTVATTPSNTPQVTDTNAAAGLSPAVGTNTPPLAPATGTNAITPIQEHAQSPDKAAVARISAEDLRERMRSGNVVVVDVRDANSFAQGHIAGAMHVPFATVEAQLASLPKGKEFVTYCT